MLQKKILKNKSYFLYPFYFNTEKCSGAKINLIKSLENVKLGDVLDNLKFSKSLNDQIKKKKENLNIKLWKKNELKVSGDLYPHIQKIFNETEKTGDGIFSAYPALKINDNAKLKTLFQGAWGGSKGGGLEVKLTKSSLTRLKIKTKKSVWTPFLINTISVQLFGTGVGIATIELEVLPNVGTDKDSLVTSSQIIETTNNLTRLKDKAPDIRWVGEYQEDSNFKLEDLLYNTIPFFKKNQECQLLFDNRVFTYTAVEISDNAISDLEKIELAYRLSVQHTEDYLPELAEMKKTIYQPFKNITHVSSIMGGGVLVNTSDIKERSVSFLDNYLSNSVPTVYWPLTLLAYQEYQMLIKLSQETYLVVDFNELKYDHLSKLEEFQMKFLDFRLNYRFSHASKIGMHNAVYGMWRKALSLNIIMKELKDDVQEVSNYLEIKLQEKEEERINKLNKNLSILGVFFGVIIAITSSIGMSFKILDGINFFSKVSFVTFGGVILMATLFTFIYTKIIDKK